MHGGFSSSACWYDTIYAWKDYAAEAATVREVIEARRPEATTLLDVACGTGAHLAHLADHFTVQGLDLAPELLEVARGKHPDVPFHEGDMTDFDLGTRFDVVTCLFSSIGYARTRAGLRAACAGLARHLLPGGLAIVEPWFTPDVWQANTVHMLCIDEPELKIARVNTSTTVDGVSVLDLHHLIGTPAGTEHVLEHHELGLFTVEETTAALAEAGFAVTFDPEGLTGRGLYVGTRS